LQQLREDERTRLARETHDVLGGALTGLKLDLARLRRRMVTGALAPADVPAELDEASRAIDGLVQAVRRIATELRPPLLDDLGLAAAIDWQLQEFARRSGLSTAFSPPAEPVPLEPEQATAVFRVFQEALTNVARHAQATHVQVSLACQPGDHVVLVVQDNGRGLTPQTVANSKSLGLLGMRERVRLLAGELEIQGAAGAGTTVTVRVPVHLDQ
jgi:signal transduction histidine kinase